MKDRIKQIRKHCKMSQGEFGECLGVSRDAISNYELGRVIPSDLFINHLCSTYNVNRIWLETGEGEMFAELSEDEELAMIFGEVLCGEMDPRRIKLIKSIMNIVKNIPDESLPVIGDYARQVADALEEKKEDEA